MNAVARDEEAIGLATKLSEIASALLAGRMTVKEALASIPSTVTIQPAEGAQLTLVPLAPTAKSEREDARAIARRVFAYWQRRCNHERAKPTPERFGKILARLRDGYSERDMLLAIEGCTLSDHHMGTNDRNTVYNDIELILRNGTKLESFRRIAEEHGARIVEAAQTPSTPEDAEIARLRGEAALAKREGRTDDYNRLVRSVRAAEQRRK